VCGLFFFSQLVVPSIVAKTQLSWQGFGFANAEFAAFVKQQE
jgi:hypothetical protein